MSLHQKTPEQIISFQEHSNHHIKLEGQYDGMGLYQGTHRFWDNKGHITFEAKFVNGVQTSATHYFPNGKPEEEKHFLKGKLHGPEKKWFPGGELKWERNYQNGRLHGWQKEFYAEGGLKSEQLFEEGVLKESKAWDRQGGRQGGMV